MERDNPFSVFERPNDVSFLSAVFLIEEKPVPLKFSASMIYDINPKDIISTIISFFRLRSESDLSNII